jgi:exopolysaccharide biosynthesis polyprenyl glycosylphosphotransferase
MLLESFSFSNLTTDLRSAQGTQIQRGLIVRLIRVLALFALDASSLALAWKLTTYIGITTQSFPLVNLTIVTSIFIASDLYKAGINRRNYGSIIQGVSISFVLLSFIAFIYAADVYPAHAIFVPWLLSILFICTARYLFDASTQIMRKKGAVRHPIFIITDVSEQKQQIDLIQQENCYVIQGVNNSTCLDLAYRQQTLNHLRNLDVSEVFISWNAIKNRLHVCWYFYNAGMTIRILPSAQELYHPKSELWMLGEMPCLAIPAPLLAGSDFWMKRIFDVICSIILLIIFSPLYLTIAILIKLDSPGPILFKQDRVGLHGKKFKIWKFRTMVTNAEKLQAALETKNEIKDGVLFKLKDDPRITKVGKFLRHYSLDELPQLFNIVLGEMSLVGPRPLPLRDVERFKTQHFIRQEVLPGITGLWQVSGRSDIDNFEDGVRLDITYIENWSIWLDMKILFKTVGVVFTKDGAY